MFKKNIIPKELLEECLESGLTQLQMAERFKTTIDNIRNNFKLHDLKFLGSKYHNKGEGNPAKRTEVKRKISQTVSTLWEDGYYSDRINGMIGKTGTKNPNYTFHKYGYREYLLKYQSIDSCSLCNRVDTKIDVHHIDEDHNNWLITNLEPLCVCCHQKYHLKAHKLPFVILGVRSSFAGAHNLLNYNGKCANKHGHEWVYEIKIRKRIHPDTGMATDFKEIKQKMRDFIDEVLDHSDLNEVLPFNPTAENIAVWIFETLSKKALLKGVISVTIWETPTSSMEVLAEAMLEIEKEREVKEGGE